MRERRRLCCHFHPREGSGHAAACASVSPTEPQIHGATPHHCGLKGCVLQAQLPTPAPLILNSFGVQNPPGSGGITLSCPAPQNPGREQTPTAPSCSHPSSPSVPQDISQSRVLGGFSQSQEANQGQDPAQKRGGRVPRGLTPVGSHPKVPSPQCCPQNPRSSHTQTRQRSLGDVTQETDMTAKWGLEKLLNAGRVTRACQRLLKKK